MSAIPQTFSIEPLQYPTAPAQAPLLQEAPSLLEYRGDADPDVEFIPKTVAGFMIGGLAMGLWLDVAETIWMHNDQPFASVVPGMVVRFAFMVGIIGVASSLLLVGLKVRADHSLVPLFAKHWLNSIGTGSVYAFMMYVAWIFVSHSIMVNRYLAAVVLMIIMVYPAIAAKWTIGRHVERRAAV